MVSGRPARSRKSGSGGPERLGKLTYQFDQELNKIMKGRNNQCD